ncbi:MAG: CAP domain-containing protein [Candidatus Falkowbacteria bacterium]
MTQKNNKKRGILYLILAYLLYKLVAFFWQDGQKKYQDIRQNLKDFFRSEEREINELRTGRETFSKYCSDSSRLFYDYFIPHDGNSHKPKILRAHSLALIIVLLVVIKISLVGYLFLVYPEEGRMTENMTEEILTLINGARAEAGLGTVNSNLVLNIAAHEKAEDMIAKGYFAHHSPDGKKPWDWIDRGQYKYLFVGENLAMNFTSADSAHRALMNSPSHKHNILNDRYADVGLAMVTGTMNGKQTNVLVQLFGTTRPAYAKAPAGEPAPSSPADVKPATPETVAVLADDNKKEEEKPAPAVAVVKPAIKPAPKTETVESKPADKVSPNPTAEEKTMSEPEILPAIPPVLPETVPAADGQKLAMADPASPNSALEKNIPSEPLVFKNTADARTMRASGIARAVNYVFVAILTLLIMALIVNIIVRYEIQHKHVILQSFLVILFVSSLIYFKFHALEGGLSDILVLSI